jgi:hypothetical protein
MSFPTEINVIMQGGCMVCPLCHSQRRWRYKRDLVHYPFQSGTVTQDYPYGYNGIDSVVVTADNKVRFLMRCHTCNVIMETDSMELINKENYDKYKEDE